MLVLSRKKGQEIVIGDNITVTVLSIHGGRVKLGCSGPKAITIHREEVHRRKSDDPLFVDLDKQTTKLDVGVDAASIRPTLQTAVETP